MLPHLIVTAAVLLGQVDGLPGTGAVPNGTRAGDVNRLAPPNRLEALPAQMTPTSSFDGEEGGNTFPAANASQRIVETVSHETANDSGGLSGVSPIPLAPRSAEVSNPSIDRPPPTAGSSIVTVVSSLAIVLGVFFVGVWVMRRGAPAGSAVLPGEVVQVLGRAALSPRQQMQLVRVGDKLVLLAVSSTGVQPLTEVTDAEEVERLVTACEATRENSASSTFRQVLAQLGQEPAAGGFFGTSQSRGEDAGG